jgi:hypothetical protein
VLNEAGADETAINANGGAWTTNGSQFIVNRRILGGKLGSTASNVCKVLKGFNRKRVTARQVATLVGIPGISLVSPNNWELRWLLTGSFGPTTTEAEAASLTRILRAGEASVAWLPLEMRPLVNRTMAAMMRTSEKRKAILDLAIESWQATFGNVADVSRVDAETALCPERDVGVLETFNVALGKRRGDEARFFDRFSFVHFLELFTNYGTPDGLLAGLREITGPGSGLIDGMAVASSTNDIKASLVAQGSFMIMEGCTPGQFLVVVRSQGGFVQGVIVADPTQRLTRLTLATEPSCTAATWPLFIEALQGATINGVQLVEAGSMSGVGAQLFLPSFSDDFSLDAFGQ